MNAGAYGGEMRDVLADALVIGAAGGRRGGPGRARHELPAVGRSRPGEVVAEAVLELRPGDPARIRETVADMQRRRREAQPAKVRTFGSVWKNPDAERTAGRLLEECGLKGYAVGGARISPVHANFIENHDGARSADVIALMREARRRARERRGGAGARGADARADRARRLDCGHDRRRSADRLAGLGGRASRRPPTRSATGPSTPTSCASSSTRSPWRRTTRTAARPRRSRCPACLPGEGRIGRAAAEVPRHGICCQCRPGAAPAPAGTQEGGGEAQARAPVSGRGVVLAPGGYWVLANSSAFAVSGVSVSGGGTLLERRGATGGGRRRRADAASSRSTRAPIERAVEQLPYVRTATVDRSFPHTLSIRITTYRPAAAVAVREVGVPRLERRARAAARTPRRAVCR